MPRYISDAVHQATEWLFSTAGAPVRTAYDFVFPPLESSGGPSFNEGVPGMSTSSAFGASADDALEHLDVWDSFSESPWSFVASRYTVALIIVAIVNNRVQHICRPRGGASERLSQLQRVALRLPSLVLLVRAVLILTTVAADAFLSETNLVNLVLRTITTTAWRDAWLANKPMQGWALDNFGSSSRDALLRARDASALWAAFTSTCVAIISDTTVRNLDADRDEPPAFNLVGFAFSLHFHSFSPDAPANDHVYLCILLQMLQILTITLSRCQRPALAPRLVISSFFGMASLIHYALAASSGRYPSLEALSRTPEIALVLIVLLTVTLHALTMLLLEGRIQPHRLLFSRSNLPSLEEDWSLALFKLGTACMESTRLTGLEREMEPLVAWDAPYIELSRSGRIAVVEPLLSRTSASAKYGPSAPGSDQNGLSREIKHVHIESNHGSASTFSHTGLARIRALIRFATVSLLVARSLMVITVGKMLRVMGLPDPSVPRWVYRVLRLARLVWHGSNGEAQRRERQADAQRQQQQQQQRERYQHREPEESRDHASMRGLLGLTRWFGSDEGLVESNNGIQGGVATRIPPNTGPLDDDSDQEDIDYNGATAERELVYDSDEAETDSDEVHLEPDELSSLFEELSTSTPSSSEPTRPLESFNALILAHLTHQSSQPLTRSGYTSLLEPQSSTTLADRHLAQTLLSRRPRSSGALAADDSRRLCVVCCTEERNVICWPCRCLCLCMDCREHLASRPPARRAPSATHDAAHLCPTCRTPVAAFSRLYIP